MYIPEDLPQRIKDTDAKVMEFLQPVFAGVEDIRDRNIVRVLNAFCNNRIASRHMGGSTGYGYGDEGRERLDSLMAEIMGTESALCREQFMSGTHALTVALFGLLRPGDTLLAATGKPYDTLLKVIGVDEDTTGSLKNFGVKYDECPFKGTNPDYEMITAKAKNAAVVHVQKSRGYSQRRSLSNADVMKIADLVHGVNPKAVVFVDNCYGEFTETTEPGHVGADIVVGSLIKNAGGGIAETGGYIAGRADLVEFCADRLTAPGTGGEIGSWPTGHRNTYLGIFMAPQITAEAVKASIYSAALYTELGFDTNPKPGEAHYDIVTAINLYTPENLCKFCCGIQAYSPVDSNVAPTPWAMPGYTDEVIMAAGTFTGGASIELSSDGPLREPYTAYIQGALSFMSARYALLKTAEGII